MQARTDGIHHYHAVTLLVLAILLLVVTSAHWTDREPTDNAVMLSLVTAAWWAAGWTWGGLYRGTFAIKAIAPPAADFELWAWPWWARYMTGVGLIGAAGWLLALPRLTWMAGLGVAVLALYAIILMRELSIVIVVGGIVYFLYGAAAALPVSVAIIIGALIIAGARRRT